MLRKARLRWQSGPVRILAVGNAMGGARLGLIVGRRAGHRAHQRNRLKRTAREVFRLHANGLPPLDVVLHVQASIHPHELKSRLEDAFKKISSEAPL